MIKIQSEPFGRAQTTSVWVKCVEWICPLAVSNAPIDCDRLRAIRNNNSDDIVRLTNNGRRQAVKKKINLETMDHNYWKFAVGTADCKSIWFIPVNLWKVWKSNQRFFEDKDCYRLVVCKDMLCYGSSLWASCVMISHFY